MSIETHLREYDRQEEQLLAELFEFLRIPSVSTEKEFEQEVVKASHWVENFLLGAGFRVERWTGDGHPVIFAERLSDPSHPTVLFYQHYDVQPVDPISEWKSPPFEPTIRDGQIYCRGAQDNKGQCFYTLAGVRDFVRRNPSIPLNIKFVIEGEEEAGSETLSKLLPTKKNEVRADAVIVPDFGIRSLEEPSVTLGIRGMVSMTMQLTGSDTDLHSGMLGGVVYNPNRALAEMLGTLFAEDGSVNIPGFYDDVAELSEKERSEISFAFDEQQFRRNFGAAVTGGEHRFSPFERAWVRPTLEINGIGGGYTGSGFKTVIPAHALAKISCRIVPNQDPEQIARLVKNHLERLVPPGITCDIEVHQSDGESLRTPLESPLVTKVSQAISEACGGRPCGAILSGGSIPVISKLTKVCGGEAVFVGYGFETDQIHAPNEHFGLDRVRLGFATIGRLIELFSQG